MKTTIRKLLRNACFILLSVISFQAKADTIPLHFVGLDTTTVIKWDSDNSVYYISIYSMLNPTLEFQDTVYINYYDSQKTKVLHSSVFLNTNKMEHIYPYTYNGNNSKLSGVIEENFGDYSWWAKVDIKPIPDYPNPGVLEIIVIRPSVSKVFKLTQVLEGSLPTDIEGVLPKTINGNVFVYDFSGQQVFSGDINSFYSQHRQGLFIVKKADGSVSKIYID